MLGTQIKPIIGTQVVTFRTILEFEQRPMTGHHVLYPLLRLDLGPVVFIMSIDYLLAHAWKAYL